MEELLNTSLRFYWGAFLFLFLWCMGVLIGLNAKLLVKSDLSKGIKTLLRICSICAAVCCLSFFFMKEVYPITLAAREYREGLTTEGIGIIEQLNKLDKDHIAVTINGQKYSVLYSSAVGSQNIMVGLGVGDEVRFIAGTDSHYLFAVQIQEQSS